ncbi:membrane hypothetical protein [Candidatus Roizmanbacteria bacterium]|nr:membrane hypothetical protein [Candidatus Roizmanbacteria bacterium]
MKIFFLNIVFFLLFLDLLYIKAYFYGFININYFLVSMAKFVPASLSYYLFLPFYYLFFLPIEWLLFGLFRLDKIYYNLILTFSLDIFLTTAYLVLMFFISKRLWIKIFGKK